MAQWSLTELSSVTLLDRIDGEYYLPEYISNQSILSAMETVAVPQWFFVSDGNHLSVSKHFSDRGEIPYFRGQNVNDFFIENAEPIKIPRKVYDSPMMRRSHFFSGDVLLSIVGTIGSLSIVSETVGDATGSCKIAILRSKGDCSPFFLAAFLMSKFGQLQIKRNTRGAVQMGLILKDLSRIRVPKFSDAHQAQIETIVRKSLSVNSQSKKLYTQAQQLLESELGLDKLNFQKPVGYTARFSELEQSRRLDPEHFYPAFKHLVKHLPASVTLTPLFKLIEPCQTGVQPTYSENGTVPVINSRHVLCNKIDHSSCRRAFEIDRVAMAQRGDVLLNATGAGTLGRASALLTESARIFDVCIVRIRPHSIDPVYLAAFLNTIPGQLQIERHTRGSSGQLHLYPRDVAKIQVWKAPESFQTEVRRLIEEAHKAEKDADQFLSEAKTRVEQLIEEAVRR